MINAEAGGGQDTKIFDLKGKKNVENHRLKSAGWEGMCWFPGGYACI